MFWYESYKKHFLARTALGHDELAECYKGVSATKCLINEISYTIFPNLHLLSHFKRKLTIFKIWGILSNVNVWKIQMAPFDDTNKSAIVHGESNFHQNVVDSNLPGICLTSQDMFNVYNDCIFHVPRKQLTLKFVLFWRLFWHFIFVMPTLKK
jgi:hypothetical protein